MIRRNVLFSLMGFLSGFGAKNAAAGLSCDFCGQEIQGRYLQYRRGHKTLTVCEKCDRNLSHCDACNIPVKQGKLISKHGEKLCSTCAAHAKYCSLCGKRINGRYFQNSQSRELYCIDCYNRYPKCKVCGKPTPPNLIDLASGACPECSKTIPTCQCCGKGITGSYYSYPGIDGVFCEYCHKHRDKCYICGIPLKDNYWKFPDGREICDACNKRAIIDETKIRKIMAEVEKLIPRHLGIEVKKPYTLRVETLNSESMLAAREAKQGQSSKSPLFGKELGLYRYKNGKSEIFLLYGLPPEMIYETAAHEYAHAWQTENAVAGQSPVIREGFAQWVAAQILKAKGFKQTLEKLEARRDHPYGTGYQRFKRVHENLGRKDTIKYAKRAK